MWFSCRKWLHHSQKLPGVGGGQGGSENPGWAGASLPGAPDRRQRIRLLESHRFLWPRYFCSLSFWIVSATVQTNNISVEYSTHCLFQLNNTLLSVNTPFVCPQMLKVWVTLERSSGCATRSRSAWRTTSTTGSTTPGAASGSCCCCCRRYRASPGKWSSRSSSSNSLAWPRSTTCSKKCFSEVSALSVFKRPGLIYRILVFSRQHRGFFVTSDKL